MWIVFDVNSVWLMKKRYVVVQGIWPLTFKKKADCALNWFDTGRNSYVLQYVLNEDKFPTVYFNYTNDNKCKPRMHQHAYC